MALSLEEVSAATETQEAPHFEADSTSCVQVAQGDETADFPEEGPGMRRALNAQRAALLNLFHKLLVCPCSQATIYGTLRMSST